MTTLANIFKALALWYAKKHLINLIVDASLEAAKEVSLKTDTKLDDDAVAKLYEDKEEIKSIISRFL